jgi:hypothetical protein
MARHRIGTEQPRFPARHAVFNSVMNDPAMNDPAMNNPVTNDPFTKTISSVERTE